MKIKVNKTYTFGKNKNPNAWVLDFFPYGSNTDATTVSINSSKPQTVSIESGLINGSVSEILLVPNATGLITFSFTALDKGKLIFSDKEAIFGLGQLTIGGIEAQYKFASGSFNAPCIELSLQDLPSNIIWFVLCWVYSPDSRTFVKESYNELLNYSSLKGIVLGNPHFYPNINYTSLSFNLEMPNKLSFVYIENVYTEKKLDGDLTQRTAPVNDKFFINPILTKNAEELIFFYATAKIDTDNKNVVKGKLKDFGAKPLYIEWFNSTLIEGKISDMKMQDIKILSIGGSKIKGYDEGVVFNDLVTTIDISRTGMTDLDTDKFLIDLNNSLVTNLRRTLKIKARTSATDYVVTSLINKGVVLTL